MPCCGPWRGTALYTAATVYALLGQPEQAVTLFRSGMNHGVRGDLSEEWDLVSLFDYPPLQALVRRKAYT